MHDLIGTTLAGQYTVEEVIGEGGAGVVYRAVQKSVGRNVAVKLLKDRHARNERWIRRFETEARIIGQLRHPNTIRLFDANRTADGALFIVTELLHGRSLLSVMAKAQVRPLRAIGIAEEVCGSLSEAHAAGIVHRDLKPENIFLDRVGDEDFVKVLDFGIARSADGVRLTRAGSLIGTPLYMSPEQASGGVAEARSDLYALGVIIYEMLAGRHPFVDDSPVSVLIRHLNETPKPIWPESAKGANVDALRVLERVVLSMMSKEPADRPKSAAKVRSLLAEAKAAIERARNPHAAAGTGRAPVPTPPDIGSRPGKAGPPEDAGRSRPESTREAGPDPALLLRSRAKTRRTFEASSMSIELGEISAAIRSYQESRSQRASGAGVTGSGADHDPGLVLLDRVPDEADRAAERE